MQSILVVGGAGYIGSHMLSHLQNAGYQPIVLDNLSTGHRDAVINAELIVGDMGDAALLDQLFQQHRFSAVMHFAGCIEVQESVTHPLKYYKNNVAATMTLLEKMQQYDVNHLIFSSTAAVYGEPQTALITEKHPLNPVNPYGRSKLMVEQIIKDMSEQGILKYAILRYFNAAGADKKKGMKERHQPETHLIPLILQVAQGIRENITIFGADYPTIDGTCVRDYIHVTDLCEAHLHALIWLLTKKQNVVCNLGVGRGYSVLEVLKVAREITAHSIPMVVSEKRPGDPASLVADPLLAYETWGWKASADLEMMVRDAWEASRELIKNEV